MRGAGADPEAAERETQMSETKGKAEAALAAIAAAEKAVGEIS